MAVMDIVFWIIKTESYSTDIIKRRTYKIYTRLPVF